MIIGIGTDIAEIERIKKACLREAFLVRCFTLKEKIYIENHPERAAGNFAVKEAVSKAMGTGFRGMSLDEIEVLRDDLGKPYIQLYGRAKTKAEGLNISRWHVSISNTKTLAIAYVIGEGVEA
ncbi:MAG: holo-[acyl-carrier-protein] synthase [Clostridia bacterium]|nr:holo-ACP synthase [Lachnospiraceae bacterium]NCB99992.1 holo-[acyl-carrier-protein] synthase [Clostridia bacterium]NCD03535.1 holo-[acyl-carrier-protein] synthase [Clostridia bacterium]